MTRWTDRQPVWGLLQVKTTASVYMQQLPHVHIHSVENVRLFILIVALSVLAIASEYGGDLIQREAYTLILVSTNCNFMELPDLNNKFSDSASLSA